LRNGGGDLVNISSVAGRTARPGNAVYAATKWGINGWSESLRQELQPDVRVMVSEPGAVATELPEHITHAETKRATEEFVQETAIQPEDIAEVIAFAIARPQRMTLNEIRSGRPCRKVEKRSTALDEKQELCFAWKAAVDPRFRAEQVAGLWDERPQVCARGIRVSAATCSRRPYRSNSRLASE